MTLPDDWLDQLKAIFPRRDGGHGWGIVRTKIPTAIANGADWGEIMAGTKAYAIWCQKKGHIGTEYVLQAKTFYGPGQWWVEYAELATSQRAEHLKTRARQLGFAQISDELLQDLDALEAKLAGISRQREEAQKAREQAARKPTEAMVTELAARLRA